MDKWNKLLRFILNKIVLNEINHFKGIYTGKQPDETLEYYNLHHHVFYKE